MSFVFRDVHCHEEVHIEVCRTVRTSSRITRHMFRMSWCNRNDTYTDDGVSVDGGIQRSHTYSRGSLVSDTIVLSFLQSSEST